MEMIYSWKITDSLLYIMREVFVSIRLTLLVGCSKHAAWLYVCERVTECMFVCVCVLDGERASTVCCGGVTCMLHDNCICTSSVIPFKHFCVHLCVCEKERMKERASTVCFVSIPHACYIIYVLFLSHLKNSLNVPVCVCMCGRGCATTRLRWSRSMPQSVALGEWLTI